MTFQFLEHEPLSLQGTLREGTEMGDADELRSVNQDLKYETRSPSLPPSPTISRRTDSSMLS